MTSDDQERAVPRIRNLALALAMTLVLAAPAFAQSGRLVVLVRHAEAGGEPATDPPLTADGARRAGALARVLRDADIGTVIVSPRARTHLTAEPLSETRGLEPQIIGFDGGVEGHIEAVAAAVRAVAGSRGVLVVGHSNTIPAIIGALGGPELPSLCHGQYAGLFVMNVGARRATLVRGSYGAPDAPGAEECERS